MFFEPQFMIAAAVILTMQIFLLTCLYYEIKGKVAISENAVVTERDIFKRETNHKIAIVLFPVILIASVIINGFAIQGYMTNYREQEERTAARAEAFPLVEAVANIEKNLVCTSNGYIATEETIEREKTACVEAGAFRATNQGTGEYRVQNFYQVQADNTVAQVATVSYGDFKSWDDKTTLADLKTAFNVK